MGPRLALPVRRLILTGAERCAHTGWGGFSPALSGQGEPGPEKLRVQRRGVTEGVSTAVRKQPGEQKEPRGKT